MLAIPEPPIPSARIGLSLLCSDLNRAILRAFGGGIMGVGNLCAHLMLESDTTLREQLDRMHAIGVVELKEQTRSHATGYRLTRAGDGLLEVMAYAGAWLTRHPGRSLSPESDVAWRAVRALADAWELSVIQRLLLRPSARRELSTTVPTLSGAKAKRLLRRLEGAGLLRRLARDEPVPRYAVTAWGRRSIAVLAVIALWERTYLRDAAEPVAATDGAVGLLASLPLLRPQGDLAGVCSFTVEGEAGTARRSTAVWAHFADGGVTACRAGVPPGPPDAWVHGGVGAWLDAVIHAKPTSLKIGGDRALAEHGLLRLHEELFGNARSPR